jgi:aspartate kinase
MAPALTIAKFGGTSVADYAAMQSCARIIAQQKDTRVVVVSASAGVTNYLVSLCHDNLDAAGIAETVAGIKQIQYAIHECLPESVQRAEKLESLLAELTLLAGQPSLRTNDMLKEQVLSMGERMSSLLFTDVLLEMGVAAEVFDVKQVLRTDDNFGAASPILPEIKRLAQVHLAPRLASHVQVTQGFVGSDEQGRTTTLGRGGSDFTAALLAEALKAQLCQIWTDVIGVYTTDPRITSAARPLPELSFEEAAEMATFGAKVLHPATMEPALRQDIKVFVGSSKEPEKGGTIIVRDCQDEPPYRAITRRKEQVMVTVKTPKMMYAQGFLAKVFEIIAKHELSVDLVTTSEISVSFTLDNPPNSVAERLNRETITELQDICEVTVERGFDLITVVGNNMQTSVGVSSKILSAVTDNQLRMICFGANPHNMSFLVQAHESDEIVQKLHRELFE